MPAEAILVSGSYHRAQALKRVIEQAGWRLRVHTDATAALRDIREQPYDALFCDERLKGATAGGFLSWHERLNPSLPFYAIAVEGGELSGTLRGRPTQVLPFPLALDSVPAPADSTLWRERERDDGSVVPLEGNTSTVPLAHLVELLSLNDGGAVVETSAGAIHFADGRIEHASFVAAAGAEAVVGLRALGELIGADDLTFKVLPYRRPMRRSVNLPIMLALTEATRQRDESMRNRRLLTAVKEGHPEATGLAVGYPVNAAPDDELEDGAAAHGLLYRYADATKGVAGIGQPTHLALEGQGVAWALMALRNGVFLSGTTVRGRSLNLLATMVKCVRALEKETA
jgi:hypothetical protein